jgi:hypothetical protein
MLGMIRIESQGKRGPACIERGLIVQGSTSRGRDRRRSYTLACALDGTSALALEGAAGGMFAVGRESVLG